MSPAASPTTPRSDGSAAVYRVVPDQSKVWCESDTDLHPIYGVATGLEGELRLAVRGGGLDLTTPPAGHIELDVDRLRSDNRFYDTEMKRLVGRRHPKIRGTITSVEEIDPSQGRYRITGDIFFHGETQQVTGEVVVTPVDDRTVIVEGERVFDIRPFGMEPPTMRMLKVQPEVTVKLRLTARRDD